MRTDHDLVKQNAGLEPQGDIATAAVSTGVVVVARLDHTGAGPEFVHFNGIAHIAIDDEDVVAGCEHGTHLNCTQGERRSTAGEINGFNAGGQCAGGKPVGIGLEQQGIVATAT